MSFREELDELLSQRAQLEIYIAEAHENLASFFQRRSDVDRRIFGLIAPKRPRKGTVSPLQEKILTKIETVLKSDRTGTFSSELERILGL